jgi:tetratricopeptide (TPR) repeat protein
LSTPPPAAKSDPGAALGLLARAFDLQQRGQLDNAEALYAQALVAHPDDPTALVNGGVVALARGDPAMAIARFEHAARVAPRNAIVQNNLGFALLHANRLEEALAACDRALVLQSQLATAHNHRGIALARLNRNAEARAAFAQALALDPRLTLAALNLGEQANHAGDGAAAVAAYDRALALEPGNVHAATGRAFAVALSGDLPASTQALEAIVARAPHHAPAWQTLGAVRNFAWNHDGAESAFQRALTLVPNDVDARFGVASARLGRGDYAAGWEAFEQRPDRAATADAALASMPQWDGHALDGTLVVYGEQGFGDIVQFARFVPPARQRARAVVVLLNGEHAALAPLLATLEGVDRVLTQIHDLPAPDRAARVSILSLPHRLGIDARSLAMAAPYLHVPEDRRAPWLARMHDVPRPRVGLAWSVLARDVHGFVTRHKSIPPHVLAPLVAGGGAAFVTLQPGLQGDPAPFGRQASAILDVRGSIGDFADTAALIEQLDLVISADTAVAHVAGALGKPVWMLDRSNTCWRWRAAPDASPWYPSMRIFRQSRFGDWSDVATRVATAFAEWRTRL